MTFTDTGISTAGRIYDVNEKARLEDFANRFSNLTEEADRKDTKDKDKSRYIIIGVGSLVILGLFILATRKK
jgi:hypothetical protein